MGSCMLRVVRVPTARYYFEQLDFHEWTYLRHARIRIECGAIRFFGIRFVAGFKMFFITCASIFIRSLGDMIQASIEFFQKLEMWGIRRVCINPLRKMNLNQNAMHIRKSTESQSKVT